MDVYGIEALLGLPEFRVIDQVIHPKRLDLHLQRRNTSIVCPRCQTCCYQVQESRPRCMRDLAHPGAPGCAVAASATLCVSRMPPSALGEE
jgi:hypothetical protein